MDYRPLWPQDANDESHETIIITCRSGDSDRDNDQLSLTDREAKALTEDEVYTVEDAVNQLGFGLFQIIVTFFSGLTWVRSADQACKC